MRGLVPESVRLAAAEFYQCGRCRQLFWPGEKYDDTMATLKGLSLNAETSSEKDAELAQKLGQLQSFLAAFPQECMGQLPSFGPT